MIETDKRIGKILAVLDARGLFDSTLFVITTDHGMAPIDTGLAADQVQAVLDAGLKAVVPGAARLPAGHGRDRSEPCDGRPHGDRDGARRTTPTQHGEQPPVAGARVQGHRPRTRRGDGRDEDGRFGVCGLPLPVGEDPEHLVVCVEHEGFNPRHLRLDGTNVVEDIRKRLYGSAAD